MATVKLHQDVLGHRSGETVEVDGTQGEWLVANGYASVEGETDEDKHLVTTSDAAGDPTLAMNREAPDEFDAAGFEDEATNDEASKRADVTDAAAVRTGGDTEHRVSDSPDAEAGTAGDKATYEGGDEPTAGAQGIPVDDSAPVPAVADARTDGDADSDDSEADKA